MTAIANMSLDEYSGFLARKVHASHRGGFKPVWMPDFLFDFQSHLVDWNLWTGRSATFADCGLGKTPIQLVWAENVHRKTNRPVLIATPLAVAAQTEREAKKFDIEAKISRDGKAHRGITITNYEQLHKFRSSDFAGLVCDESSILKNFDGMRRKIINSFMRPLPYRLLCTATAAPNDYIELGTSSEALGYLGHMDMLNRYFKNDLQNSSTHRGWGQQPKWRFKGHAEIPFWRYVCSWARATRKPSDLGFEDGGFILPPLEYRQHIVEARRLAPGLLFPMPAITRQEQLEERRRTITERCEKVAALIAGHDQSLIWCHLNDEGDLLAKIVPNAVQVSGKDSDESKEEKMLAFASGDIQRLITKTKIGAWGLNFQSCAHETFFPSHSFEQFYQGVRRCWRFGQTRPVTVDIVTTDGESAVLANLQRKEQAAQQMFSRLVELMNNILRIDNTAAFTDQEKIPTWL